MTAGRVVCMPQGLCERIAGVLLHSGRPADWEAFMHAALPEQLHALQAAARHYASRHAHSGAMQYAYPDPANPSQHTLP